MRPQGDISTAEMFVYVGVFPNENDAMAAVRELRSAGISDERIGILSKSDGESQTRWEEGTAVGAVTGGLTGTGLGLAVAAGLIPAIGPAVVGGLFAALLASAATGAAVGTAVGGLIGLGVPEDDASYYHEQFAAGRSIVAVQTEGSAPWVNQVFKKHNAVERGNIVSEQPLPDATT